MRRLHLFELEDQGWLPASLRDAGTDMLRYVAERVVLRTKDVRQAIQVAKLCDSPGEGDRFEGGA